MNERAEVDTSIISDKPVTEAYDKLVDDRATKIAEFFKRSFYQRSGVTGYIRRVVAIVGPWGSGKYSLFQFAVNKLDKWQPLWFEPTSFESETEIAAAFLRAAIKQIKVEDSAAKRFQIKMRLWWHTLNLWGGIINLFKRLAVLMLRLLVFVGLPVLAYFLLPESVKAYVTAIAAAIGGTAGFGDRIKQAIGTGLGLNPDEFVRRVRVASTTNAI